MFSMTFPALIHKLQGNIQKLLERQTDYQVDEHPVPGVNSTQHAGQDMTVSSWRWRPDRSNLGIWSFERDSLNPAIWQEILISLHNSETHSRNKWFSASNLLQKADLIFADIPNFLLLHQQLRHVDPRHLTPGVAWVKWGIDCFFICTAPSPSWRTWSQEPKPVSRWW